MDTRQAVAGRHGSGVRDWRPFMRAAKPRIFVSSTIYDFRDLRSALKYWLEQFGYEVRLSEFNDFTKRLDENAYNACLRAIEESDYYVLLIGTRVGGLYSTQGVQNGV